MENNVEQFTQISHSLMSNKDLTDQDKLTLGLILSWVKNDKECFMGNEYIAEMMGISKNAASIRIKRLEKIGCISLRYTYREGTKEVDKRFITLLSMTPQVSSDRQQVSSRRRRGIVSQTKGSRPTDDEVSSKQGGIIQPDYTSLLNNELKKLPHNVLNNEISLEEQLEQIINLINENKFETNDARGNAYQEKSKIEIQLKQLTNEQSRN
jgi:hypothetical protein